MLLGLPKTDGWLRGWLRFGMILRVYFSTLIFDVESMVFGTVFFGFWLWFDCILIFMWKLLLLYAGIRIGLVCMGVVQTWYLLCSYTRKY